MDGREDDLFGAPAPARRRRSSIRVAPVAMGEAQYALAERLPHSLRLGTSTWSFPGWRGIVYDGDHDEATLARHGLAAYAAHPVLRTVGIDRSFYSPLTVPTLERLAQAVPDDFRFLMKAHAALTTPKSAPRPAFLGSAPEVFLDAAYASEVVIGPAQRLLGARLGVVLIQFSPLGARVLGYRRELLARLGTFLGALPRGVTYAIEWRDAAILGADYHRVLAEHGAVHGLAAHPRLPPIDEQGADPAVNGPLVIRWLLARDRLYEQARNDFSPFDRLLAPDPDTRGRIVTLARSAIERGREVYVIINNKAEGSAPLGAFALAAEFVR
jgi:uncharacterized protein YecE (DUF72 family)